MSTKNKVYVVGVGMTNFEKPGKRDWDYPDMAKEACTQALADAGIPYDAVEQAVVGYCYGDSTCGQRAIYQCGLTGIPVINVNNNCSTGSTALYVAKKLIEGGIADCVLALGFEKMERGSLQAKWTDRTNPLDKHVEVMADTFGITGAPFAPQMFGNAGREHMQKYGTKLEHFAKIAEKNHRHSAKNPRSQFRDVYTVEQILKSKKVHEPLTMLQCCPTSEGSAAAVLCSENFVFRYGLQKTAVYVAAMSMATDMKSSFDEKSMIKCVGWDMSKKAADDCYRQAGLTPKDMQVVELHDCFSANELITYEALGLCPVGKAGEYIDSGSFEIVNRSGGLISKGHPLGATGLAQCAELCWQIRGLAEERQLPNVRAALQHNLGLGGAAVVTIYTKPEFSGSTGAAAAPAFKAQSIGHAPAAGSSSSSSSSSSPAAPAAAPAPAASSSSSSSSGGGSGYQSEAAFAKLSEVLKADSKVAGNLKSVFQYTLTKDGQSRTWTIDLKNGSVYEGEAKEKADVQFTLSDADFMGMLTRKANPQQLFMSGKLKIKGNIGAAMAFEKVLKSLEASGKAKL